MQRSPLPLWVKPVLAVALTVALLWICLPLAKGWLGGGPDKPALSAAPPGSFKATDPQWATLSFVKVKNRVFEDRRDTDGRIAVDDDAATPVLSPLSGRVVKVIARAGDVVKKGDPLLLVEGSEFVQGESDLIAAMAAASAARAQLTLAQSEEARQRELYEQKGAALKDLQQATSDLATAESTSRTTAASFAAARNRLRILGRTDGEIAALEAAPGQARRSAESTIPAPIGGTVTSRAVNAGEYITSAAAGGQPIYTIADLHHLWLVANLRETDAPFAHVGDTVAVTVPAYPGRIFKGVVSYVAPALDPDRRRLPLHADIANEDGALKPDMFASFRISSGGNAVTAAAVPEAGVIYEGETARVWVADPANKTLALRAIKTGRSEDGLIAAEGVAPGESVVVKGALFIDRAARSD